MGCRHTSGFTLIELLIVVAIIGIVSAIAIPNIMNAIDQSKQKRTMADIRALGEAVESYAVDASFYPISGNLNALEGILKPTYIKVWPAADGWQNGLVYTPDATPGQGYTIRSTGKDSVAEGSPSGGATKSFDCDIVFMNGQFMQWPEGTQR